jgi:predicted HicB family RNase H-like nuclease
MSGNITYRGYTPLIVSEDGEWNGRIAGIQSIETFEGETYEAAVEDFKRAVDFYLTTTEKPEQPFSGRITLQVTPEVHAGLFRKAKSAGAENFNDWLAGELEESVLRA